MADETWEELADIQAKLKIACLRANIAAALIAGMGVSPLREHPTRDDLVHQRLLARNAVTLAIVILQESING